MTFILLAVIIYVHTSIHKRPENMRSCTSVF